MKKFGTPSGAAPGVAKLNEGFDGVGTPPAERGGLGFVGAFEPPPLELDLDEDVLFEEDCC